VNGEYSNKIQWTTTSKQDVDIIQEMCLKNHHNLVFDEDIFTKQYNCIIEHEPVSISNSISKIEYDTEESFYCLEMPSGNFITRIDGKTAFSGNCRIIDRVKEVGVPEQWIKGFKDVLNTPNWNFVQEYETDNVIFRHGTGTSGHLAAYNTALYRGKSVVQGHLHSECSISYINNKTFAAVVGCLVDQKQYAFDYSKTNKKGFVNSALVIIDNQPIIEILK